MILLFTLLVNWSKKPYHWNKDSEKAEKEKNGSVE